jgi:formylmethanofuran dehydrogenase subunit E
MEIKVICKVCGEEGFAFGEVRPNDRFICIDCLTEQENEED